MREVGCEQQWILEALPRGLKASTETAFPLENAPAPVPLIGEKRDIERYRIV